MFGLDHDTPAVFDATARLRHRGRHRSAAFRGPDPVPGHAAPRATDGRGPHPHARLGALRRPARRVSASPHDRRSSWPAGHERAWKSGLSRQRDLRDGYGRREPGSRWRWRRTSATASTRTICIASTLRLASDAAAPAHELDGRGRATSGMRLTLIHPAIGHRAGESYIRTWQMESAADRRARRADAARRRDELLRRSDGSDSVRRAHGRGGDSGRDLHRRARLPDRQRVSTPRRARRHGRVPRHLGAGGGRPIRGSHRHRGGRGRLGSRWSTICATHAAAAATTESNAPWRRCVSTAGCFRASATCPSG